MTTSGRTSRDRPAGPLFNNWDDIRLDNSSNNTIGIPNITTTVGGVTTCTTCGRDVFSGAGGSFYPGFPFPPPTEPSPSDPAAAIYGDGMVLENGSNANLVQDAFVGTDYTGSYSSGYLANLGDGVFVSNSSNNQIGVQEDSSSSASTTLNLFSGNIGDGVHIVSSGTGSSVGNQVVNTYIGTDVTGSASNPLLQLGNSGDGIALVGAQDTTIGPATIQVMPPTSTTVNYTITGVPNASYTIFFFGSGGTAGSTPVLLGTVTTGPLPATGTAMLSATFSSLQPGETVTASSPKNVISGNFGNGISITNDTAVAVLGNYIGLDATGLFSNTDLSNTLDGVLVSNSSKITIGGTVTAAANVISGNLEAGIRITGSPGLASTSANLIEGNKIGTTYSGNSDVANGTNGIEIVDSPDNTIGGTTSGPVPAPGTSSPGITAMAS